MDVKCSFDEMVPLGQLRPNPRNPNQHPGRQIELLAKIIEAQGWRAPITVSTRSGLIVRGHGRYEAAKILKCETVPVDFQNYTDEAQEYEDLIADNKIAELSRFDNDMLKSMLAELGDFDFNLESIGFTDAELAGLSDPIEGLASVIRDEREIQIARKTVAEVLQHIEARLTELAEAGPDKLNNAIAIVIPLRKGSKKLFVLVDPCTRDAITELKRYAEAGERSPLECLLQSVFPMRRYENHA